MALYISKLKGVDLRSGGTGNLGASNSLVMLGPRAGILVAIHDGGKGLISVFLAKYLFPELPLICVLAGVACVFGHMFPFYLRFKGGKGLAPYCGMTVALNWKLAVAIILLVIVVMRISGYYVAGTFTTITAVPVYYAFLANCLSAAGIISIASAAVFLKHRENIAGIINGTEPRINRSNRERV